ncbi:uncharacterized protein MEPE_04754 [Melanopsichium pennsylvanicum]|uniref:F-box domain-containing protein n=2 Tax=Melanopsichium pennsylvanicum TaxID=63383 RepID=A0AAJ4XNT9_9BASI|nr:putative protein [Melanopsichium pennsylvanicum 4]SNX86045.1 uncharacterized protein MEPE_04754 [Melanopsichium pennsylvanicum]
MTPTAVHTQAIGQVANKTLEEQLSSLSIHDPAGEILSQLGDDVDHSDLLPQPRLPPEVLERIVLHLKPGVLIGDPIAHVSLIRLSCVSRLTRYWALEALYSIVILPRHVREFRKWYSRSVKAQPAYQFAGYTRALFCSLDDVSALTSFSAGWDHELLRLLHYCGPTLTHLSLWRAESMALLRDPGQVREGYRFGTSQPVQVWGELDNNNDAEDDAQDEEKGIEAPEAAHADDLFSQAEMDDMPGWLKAEIRLQGTRAVAIRHKAHLTPTRRFTRRQQGCQPTHLSIMMSLPLLEHEDPKVFSRMLIWHRVQELDVHISTPGHAPKILMLIASLRESPIRRLRVSTTFASLVLMTPPFPPSKRQREAHVNGGCHNVYVDAAPPISGDYIPVLNLCDALTSMLQDDVLCRVLVDELQGRSYSAVPNLEEVLTRRCLEGPRRKTWNRAGCSGEGSGSGFDTRTHAKVTEEQVNMKRQADLGGNFRLTITRGGQAMWAKLKDRLWDFRQRAEGLSEGSWEMLT